jgi:hypothetical protein
MGYRALERVTWQDGEGHTNVSHAGEEVPVGVAFHAPEAVEDTDEDVDLGPGTTAAEQKGLEPEGASTIEQGKFVETLNEGSLRREGPFASSYLPDEQGRVTSSGAPIGTAEDLQDVEHFRAAQAEADEAAARRQEERTASLLADTEQAYAEQVVIGQPAAATTETQQRAAAQTQEQRADAARQAEAKAEESKAAKK